VNDSLTANASDIERLVKASRAGDRDSFDELVRTHQRRAMQLAVRILGSADEAAEVVQDGFVRAYLNIGKLRQPERFEAWLLRIIANAAINRRKAAKLRVEKIEIVARRENTKALSPMEKQIGKELQQAIRRAMLKLSKKEAKAIALFGIENMPQEKVAEIMGCSASTVRWHVFCARKKLRVLLKEYLE
jgi:RNA polymerase sigma-70 factor (ECF subfamily)